LGRMHRIVLMLWLAASPLTGLAQDSDLGGEIRLGVLAHRGPEAAVQAWTPTAEYLTRTVPGHQFRIVQLNNTTSMVI
jgi:hypothetical protein